VHAAGGLIFAQLWHTGRVGHSTVRNGVLPVSASALAIQGQQHFTMEGPKDYEVPRALTTEEVRDVVQDYRSAAVNAKAAGFDGVELHGAFGYLPNQFLCDGSNQRTDEYGGSIENRSRFTLEIMHALVDVWGADRVGIKLSPSSFYNSVQDSNSTALYTYLIAALNQLPLAYLHLMRPFVNLDALPNYPKDMLASFAHLFDKPIMMNGGYQPDAAEAELQAGKAALVSFGVLYLSNPDLPQRIAQQGPYNEIDRARVYGGGDEKGYTDYPSL
jgi:N-ethylmaleimide reductase